MKIGKENREKMKKLICYLINVTCAMVLLMSCKEDDDVQIAHDVFPVKVELNGVTMLELIFDTHGKLTRLNNYENGEISAFYLYEYNALGIEESRMYNVKNGSVLNFRQAYTLDNLGRIIQVEYYDWEDDFDAIKSVGKYKYDPSGRLIRRELRPVGEAVAYIEEFSYSAEGLCIKREMIYHQNQPGGYRILVEYVPGEKPMYEPWKDFVALLMVSNDEDAIWNMFYDSFHRTYFNNDGDIMIDQVVSTGERQINSEGYLTRQVFTITNLKHPQDDPTVNEETYEYTK